LTRKYGVERLRVYGSVARGEADLTSDVDLLVEFRPGADSLATSSLKADLERVIGRKVDLHDPRDTYWAIRDRVLSEAIDPW